MEIAQRSQSPESRSRRSSVSYADLQEQVVEDEVCKYTKHNNYSNHTSIALWCARWLSFYLGPSYQPSSSIFHLHGMSMCCSCFNSIQSHHKNSWKRASSSWQASSQHDHLTRKYSVWMAITSGLHHPCLQRSIDKIWISLSDLWRHVQHFQVNLYTQSR